MPRPRYPDGLYQVTTDYYCAGFVLEGGKVKTCAPVLRRNLVLADGRPSHYIMRRAVHIQHEPDQAVAPKRVVR